MNQQKVGEFIAKLRKENHLTQEEVADKLGITSQSVSKWERGVNSPDISLLMDLSEILGVGVEELLCGEKNDLTKPLTKQEKTKKMNSKIIESIKFYENILRKKYVKMCRFIILLFVVVCFALLGSYVFNNYNQVKIYELQSENDDLSLNGRMIYNPSNRIITINKLEYNDINTGTEDEIMAKKVLIKLVANNRTIIQYGNLNNAENQKDSVKLNEILNNIDIDITDESIKNDLGSYNDKNDKLILVIDYIDNNNNLSSLEFELKTIERFANDKFFY